MQLEPRRAAALENACETVEEAADEARAGLLLTPAPGTSCWPTGQRAGLLRMVLLLLVGAAAGALLSRCSEEPRMPAPAPPSHPPPPPLPPPAPPPPFLPAMPAPLRLQWDPEELPPSWWLPLGAARLCGRHCGDVDPASGDDGVAWQPPACANVTLALRLSGYFGRTNNFLREWANALAYAVTRPRAAATALVLSDAWALFIGEAFDGAAATRGWACVLTAEDAARRGLAPIAAPTNDAFYTPMHAGAGLAFQGRALHQLLLRPSEALRRAVEQFERTHGLEAGYNVVHLRWLEGSCPERMQRPCVLSLQRVGGAWSADDVCRMSDRYVDAALREARALGRPLVLSHDGQQSGWQKLASCLGDRHTQESRFQAALRPGEAPTRRSWRVTGHPNAAKFSRPGSRRTARRRSRCGTARCGTMGRTALSSTCCCACAPATSSATRPPPFRGTPPASERSRASRRRCWSGWSTRRWCRAAVRVLKLQDACSNVGTPLEQLF